MLISFWIFTTASPINAKTRSEPRDSYHAVMLQLRAISFKVQAFFKKQNEYKVFIDLLTVNQCPTNIQNHWAVSNNFLKLFSFPIFTTFEL